VITSKDYPLKQKNPFTFFGLIGKADSRLVSRNRYLEVLHQFALSQAGLNTLEEIVWNVAKAAIAQLGFEDCVVYLLDEDGETLVQVAAHGPKNPVATNILNPITIKLGIGVVGTAAATGEFQLVSDTRKNTQYIVDDEIRFSELAVPIEHEGKVIGVLDSEHRQANFYTDEHVQLFTTIASLASTRIDTAMVMARLQATVERLRAAESRLASQAQALELAKLEAEQTSMAKSHFLANMSHELRTPMTAIVGFAEMLTRKEAGAHDLEQWSNQLKLNADHLLDLIGNVLDLSKIESGTLTADLESCSLGDLLADVMTLSRPMAITKNLPFTQRFEGSIPERIITDPVKFKQVLLNLISNAIKYTREEGVVVRVSSHIRSWDKHVSLILAVEDSGIGMSDEAVSELFKPFSRVHGSPRMAKVEGVGLGLSIAKGFAELLGDGITVESALGQGSVFTVTLDVGDLESITMVKADAFSLELRTPHEKNSAAKVLSGRRIILCEDSPSIATLMNILLEEAGAEIVLCENGLLGVEEVLKGLHTGRPPDVVLMDMQMPVMDGYEATRILRERGYNHPVLALTAFAMADDKVKCMAAGCDLYIQKPVNPRTFASTISNFLHGFNKPTASN
jgi:signal transduction histidine kinase/ActR/RegA family two-component response regulator